MFLPFEIHGDPHHKTHPHITHKNRTLISMPRKCQPERDAEIGHAASDAFRCEDFCFGMTNDEIASVKREVWCTNPRQTLRFVLRRGLGVKAVEKLLHGCAIGMLRRIALIMNRHGLGKVFSNVQSVSSSDLSVQCTDDAWGCSTF